MGSDAFRVTAIDTWNMTETPLGVMRGSFRVPLPAREYMAILLQRVKEENE